LPHAPFVAHVGDALTARRTPPWAVWAGLVCLVGGLLPFSVSFFQLFLSFSFFFSVLFLFIFSDLKILRFF
jgi:hypothetical protein